MTAPLQKAGAPAANGLPLKSGNEAPACPQTTVCFTVDELPLNFTRVIDEASRNEFFLTESWFRNFAQTAVDKDQTIRVYAVARGTTPAAIFFARTAPRANGLASLRTLSSLTNYYSCLFAPHLSEGTGNAKEMLDALALHISRETPRWDAVEIRPMDVDSAHFKALKYSFEAAGFVVQPFFCFGNWYLPVEGRRYAEYVGGLPSILRNTLSRKRKKLEKSGRAKIEIVTGGADLECAIEAYTKVYLASWKVPEPYPRFMPELIRTCARTGVLRLGMVYVDGEPAAAQLWIVHGGRALIYKLAYDERFADLSVGTILTATLMEHVLDIDRVEEIDYLSGDDAYKKDWMSHRRERWGVLALNPRTVRGALAIVRHFGGRAVKRCVTGVRHRLGATQ